MTTSYEPEGLQLAGKRLWQSVMADYKLNPAELVLLGQACRVADMITRLDEAAMLAEPLVKGSQGQPVANPLAKEAREERVLLSKLLDQIGIPADDGASQWDHLSASSRARKAALTRWRRA